VFKHIDMRSEYARRIPKSWKNISKVFAAMGDEHRQRILLLFEPGERLNVSQIAETSTLTRTTVSHHLKILRESGILDSTKEGKEVFYWIEKAYLRDALTAVLTYLEDEA
jgi:ArsR family transcriptional regulator